MRWELIEGVANVRPQAAAWDRLWQRCVESSPTARCEAVCRWHEHFHPGSPLQVVVVREGDEWLAALPLAARGWPRIATLPTNDWVAGGTLLVDPAGNAERLAEQLLQGLARVPMAGGVFRGVPLDRPAWQAVVAASQRLGWSSLIQPLHAVGTIALQASWEDTETRLGGNYRRQMAKAQRRLEAIGRLEFSVRDAFHPLPEHPALASALREGFELEARGWKGAGGTAITQQPGLLEFVTSHAASLVNASECQPAHNAHDPAAGECRQASGVRLATLRLDGQLIAFLYCWWGKDCVFTPKIAYDEAYAECSPGKLVFCWNLRELLRDGHWRLLDMAGPLADYNAKWATGSYESATLVLGKPGLAGRLFTAAFSARRRLRQWGQWLRRQRASALSILNFWVRRTS